MGSLTKCDVENDVVCAEDRGEIAVGVGEISNGCALKTQDRSDEHPCCTSADMSALSETTHPVAGVD